MRKPFVVLMLLFSRAGLSVEPIKGETLFKHTNALIHEPSPYLQQHAHNPVFWYPWEDKAFARAKRENKPVFLSIGFFFSPNILWPSFVYVAFVVDVFSEKRGQSPLGGGRCC